MLPCPRQWRGRVWSRVSGGMLRERGGEGGGSKRGSERGGGRAFAIATSASRPSFSLCTSIAFLAHHLYV